MLSATLEYSSSWLPFCCTAGWLWLCSFAEGHHSCWAAFSYNHSFLWALIAILSPCSFSSSNVKTSHCAGSRVLHHPLLVSFNTDYTFVNRRFIKVSVTPFKCACVS